MSDHHSHHDDHSHLHSHGSPRKIVVGDRSSHASDINGSDQGDLTDPMSAPVSGSIGKRGALRLIRFYKRGISPNLPPSCRFQPTCSEYAYESITKYGMMKGGRLAIWRILRCNPFGGKGWDPVP